MATKVITYFAQNAAIDGLVEKYGAMLQRLDRLEKLAMLSVCARVLYVGNLAGSDNYSIKDELSFEEYEDLSSVVCEDVATLDGSTEDEILGFCQGLINSLK